MVFWGIEVKPGKPYPFHSDNVRGRLHITQATLGLGKSLEKSIVQCAVGRKSPIFLCALLPDKIESCQLDLEFEDEELAAFSVLGPRSVHLSGYFVSDEGDDLRDDYEYGSLEEDYGETDTEDSENDTEDEYGDGFTDSDIEMFPASPIISSGVVIEEIIDDEKPASEDGQSKSARKKNQKNSLDDSSNSLQQIVVRGDTTIPVLESEDEDGFPISQSDKKMFKSKPELEVEPGRKELKTKTNMAKDGDVADTLKRKSDGVEQDLLEGERKKKNKKKKQKKDKGESAHESGGGEERNVSTDKENHPEEVMAESEGKLSNGKDQLEKKKKKQEKKKEAVRVNSPDADAAKIEIASTLNSEEKLKEAKSSKVRTYANGLVVEELSMGKPDGKKAAPGSQVSVHYIGKLRNNGKIFDSNVGRAPFKFRLGVGQVIKGWDVGLNGMRIGDKRRITIPPSMGYGAKRAGDIPPNSWLVFDVELVHVR